ncbi:MAG: thiamine pyrophosphate-dependent enzyme, partial [Parvularculales bacterium]
LRHIILVGAKPPVAFFAYPDKPGWLAPDDARFTTLSAPHQSGTDALHALCEAIKAPPEPHRRYEKSLLSLTEGPLTPDACGQAIAHFLPDHAIISDEAATCGLAVHQQLIHAAPYDILSLTGGAIGQGLPVATGAALACPERKVVCLHGDGGAMYTVQSLWTQARENLDVTSVIFSNRSYAILNIELARVGADNPGPRALSMLDLHNPDLNWVNLAEAMGVSAVQATEAHAFSDAFAHAMKTPGPHLIEAVI